MEIIPGVHLIDSLGIGRAYLYQERDRLTLIDTGLRRSAGRIFEAIERLGRQPTDLRQVIITHWHIDHAGSLAEVIERSGAAAMVHRLDAGIVRGEREGGGPRGAWRVLEPLTRLGPKARPASVSRELHDGDEIDLDGHATIIHVPGHTAGSIAVHVPARKLLFTGDAAANVLGLRPTIGMFTEDVGAARASFRKLAQLDFEVACFGHGKPIDKEASLAFRRHVERWYSGEFGR